MMRRQGGQLEENIGERLESSLIIAGEVMLKKVLPIFRQITIDSLEETRLRNMRVIEEKLDKHPLILHKKKYGRILKVTQEDLLKLLLDISFDPYGQYSLIAIITSAVIATLLLIYAIANCCYQRDQKFRTETESKLLRKFFKRK